MTADSHVYAWDKNYKEPVTCDCADEADRFESRKTESSVEQVWRDAEIVREKFWQHNSSGSYASLRRRALLVVRSLPVFPGRTVLEFGAGGGIWTEHLAAVLGGQNPITAVVFNKALASQARSKKLPNANFSYIRSFQHTFSQQSFDYIVGTDFTTDVLNPSVLKAAHRYLKPGGQLFFFCQNPSNPVTLLRVNLRRLFTWNAGHGREQAVALQMWGAAAVGQEFGDVEITPFEVIPPLKSSVGQAIGLILDRAPVARRFSRIVSFRITKSGEAWEEERPPVSRSIHHQFFRAVSVVVPCHNEEANIIRLVKTILGMYGEYIHEIIIVDDNSTDKTAEIAEFVAMDEPRVRVVRRKPPSGVGRALREGYAMASGKYILTIDCDFITIASEFAGLFEAVAEGYDGAIGSRFSSESALVHYPLSKIICNRGYHLMVKLLTGKRVRDVSNNLKLYRADILKNLDIEENHFAANVETGLKPILLNYRIREIPTSWINRTAGMGKSSFALLKVGPDYLRVLLRMTWRLWWGCYRTSCRPSYPRAMQCRRKVQQ